jgi:hypothetical protein
MNALQATIAALAQQRALNPPIIDKAIGKLHEVIVLLETAEPLSTTEDQPAPRPALDLLPVPPSLRAKDYRPPGTRKPL